ncbi:MAG: YXWGXW repeat-containing protein, partial [Gammaproteobacteria bacterium]
MKRIITILIVAAGLAGPLLVMPGTASADVVFSVSAGYGPPPLPYYPQPLCPGAGFIWTPGYWAYSDEGYFWVPGTWVLAPAIGLLWTPGWWGWHEGRYWWHEGYWGARVGYYGGIHYGYGYPGEGYYGGYWRDDDFYYNRAVNDLDDHRIHRTYDQRVDDNDRDDRVSYNGGDGGTTLRPTEEQQRFAHDRHFSVTEAQLEQERAARDNPAQRFAVNQGRPQVAATVRPGEFNGTGVVHLNKDRNPPVDPPVAHSTPGGPSFKRVQRTETVPIARPVIHTGNIYRTMPNAAVPVRDGYRSESRVQRPQPVRIEAPHVR